MGKTAFEQRQRAALTPAQCRQLADLGLLEEQIDQLQRALPKAAHQLAVRPTMTAVRKVVTSLHDDVARARKAIEVLLAARGVPGRREYLEAYERLAYRVQGRGEPVSDGLELERALEGLKSLARIVGTAVEELGPQKRGGQGSHVPVMLLHRAMADGWAVANPDDPLLPDDWRTFGAVVNVCYDAIRGPGTPEPERSVKNYRAWLNKARTTGLQID